jgi:hypothetical protein
MMAAFVFPLLRICFYMHFLSYILLLFCFAANIPLHATTRILPPEAISFSGFLPKTEFDERFQGQIIETLTTVPQGWYVHYQHESLAYLFGPVKFASTAEDYAQSLRRIVADAVAQRQALATHVIAVVALPEASGLTSKPIEPQPESSREEEQPIVNPSSESWWQKVLGIFRRRG